MNNRVDPRLPITVHTLDGVQLSLQQSHALDMLMASMRFPDPAAEKSFRTTVLQTLHEFSPTRPSWFTDEGRTTIKRLVSHVYAENDLVYRAGVDGFRRDDLLLNDFLSSIQLHKKDNPFRFVHDLSLADQEVFLGALCHPDVLPIIRTYNDSLKVDEDDLRGEIGVALDACPEPCRSTLFNSIFGEPAESNAEVSAPGMAG